MALSSKAWVSFSVKAYFNNFYFHTVLLVALIFQVIVLQHIWSRSLGHYVMEDVFATFSDHCK